MIVWWAGNVHIDFCTVIVLWCKQLNTVPTVHHPGRTARFTANDPIHQCSDAPWSPWVPGFRVICIQGGMVKCNLRTLIILWASK